MERKKIREKRAVAKMMERVVLESLRATAAGDGAADGSAGEDCIFLGRERVEVVAVGFSICELSCRSVKLILSFDFISPKKEIIIQIN